MAQKFELELVLKDAAAAQSVGDIKKQLKELKNAMLQVGEGSAEFNKLAMAAGELKEKVSQANETIANFNPDALETVGNFAGKAAAGVSLVTGAMGLLGVESADTQKMLMKVQAAMAFAQGLQQMKGVVNVMNNMASVIKTNLVSAFSTLKGAIAATGIGALVIAIGFAIEAIGEYNDSVEEQAEKQQKLNEELAKTNELYDAQAAKTEAARNAKEGGLDQLRREMELMRANGATADQLYEKKKQILESELYNLKVRKATVIEGSELELKYKKEILDKENELMVMEAERATKNLESQKNSSKNKVEIKKEVENEDALLEAIHQRHLARMAEIDEKDAEDHEKWKERRHDDRLAQLEIDELTATDEEAKMNAHLALLEFQKNEELKNKELTENQKKLIQIKYTQEVNAILKAFNDKKAAQDKAREQMISQFRIDAAKSALGTIGELFKDNAEAQKAVGAATTLIDTYIAAQKAFTSQILPGDPTSVGRGYIAAGLAVVAGLARVAAILRVDTNGGAVSATGGGGGGNTGSLQVSSQPNVSSSSQPSTLLTEQGQVANQQTQNPIYVSVSEIREVDTVVQAVEDRNRF